MTSRWHLQSLHSLMMLQNKPKSLCDAQLAWALWASEILWDASIPGGSETKLLGLKMFFCCIWNICAMHCCCNVVFHVFPSEHSVKDVKVTQLGLQLHKDDARMELPEPLLVWRAWFETNRRHFPPNATFKLPSAGRIVKRNSSLIWLYKAFDLVVLCAFCAFIPEISGNLIVKIPSFTCRAWDHEWPPFFHRIYFSLSMSACSRRLVGNSDRQRWWRFCSATTRAGCPFECHCGGSFRQHFGQKSHVHGAQRYHRGSVETSTWSGEKTSRRWAIAAVLIISLGLVLWIHGSWIEIAIWQREGTWNVGRFGSLRWQANRISSSTAFPWFLCWMVTSQGRFHETWRSSNDLRGRTSPRSGTINTPNTRCTRCTGVQCSTWLLQILVARSRLQLKTRLARTHYWSRRFTLCTCAAKVSQCWSSHWGSKHFVSTSCTSFACVHEQRRFRNFRKCFGWCAGLGADRLWHDWGGTPDGRGEHR